MNSASSSGAESSASPAHPQVGDWIVFCPRYPAAETSGPVSRLTAQRAYHPATYNPKREQFTELSNIVFSGAESAARRLVEQIKSSAALGQQEAGAASERHRERVRRLVAGAQRSELSPTPAKTGG